MDAGNHPGHPTGTVEHYEADWWTKDQAPTRAEIISFDLLPSCLSTHRRLRNERPVSSGNSTGTNTAVQMGPVPIIELSCHSCMRYRGVAMDALHEMHNLRTQIQQRENSSEENRLLIMRRASGFNQLFEAAVIKDTQESTLDPQPAAPFVLPRGSRAQPTAPETAGPSTAPIPAPVSAHEPPAQQLRARRPTQQPGRTRVKNTKATKLSNKQLADILEQHSKAEHDRWVQHPSLKWTWGADLDRGDIQQLFRAADRKFELPHSAYDESLDTGRFDGDDSRSPAMPRPEHWPPPVIPDEHVVPEMGSDDVPIHFGKFPFRRQRSAVPDEELPIGGEVTSSYPRTVC